MAWVVASQLYGVSPRDPWILGGLSMVLALVALLACARRASRVEPTVALQNE